MSRRPPGSTLTAPLFPHTTLFRSPRPMKRARSVSRCGSSPPPSTSSHCAAHADGSPGERTRRVPTRHRRSDSHSVRTNIFEKAGCAESPRSEEHTSELQSLMRTSYAVFCLKKKKEQSEATHL